MRELDRNLPIKNGVVATATYSASFSFLDSDILYSEKKHIYRKSSFSEVHASDWFIAYSVIPENRVTVRSGTELIPLVGPTLLYQPPFTIVESHVTAGPLTWECIGSTKALNCNFLNPRILTNCHRNLPRSKSEIYSLLGQLTLGRELIQEKFPSSIAERLKSHLDANFREDLKIGQIADTLNCSRENMTRTFKKVYGLTPIDYRHQLRVYQALIEMRSERSITEALLKVGFSEPGLFIQQFKKILDALPKQYKFQNNC